MWAILEIISDAQSYLALYLDLSLTAIIIIIYHFRLVKTKRDMVE